MKGPYAIFVALVVSALTAQAREMHVRASARPGGDGSERRPFRTIQAAVNVARPGDVVTIHAGVYRETVRPRRSGTAARPIELRGAASEQAIVSGAERLQLAWRVHQGSIYVANTTARVERLFAGRQEMIKARWPNATVDRLVLMPRATADAGTSSTRIVDAQLPSGNWTGAEVAIVPGEQWAAYTRRVAAYDQARRTITLSAPIDSLPQLIPRAGSPYYIRGALGLLDAPGEWFHDAATGKLYFWAPGGAHPGTLRIGYQTRELALDLHDLSFINVSNLRVFGAAVSLEHARNCTLTAVHVRYPVVDGATNGFQTPRGRNVTTGSANRWVLGSVSHSPVSGIVLGGSHQVVEGMLIHDVAYGVPGGGAGIETIDISGAVQGTVIAHNTIRRSARVGINIFRVAGGQVKYNRIEDVGLLSRDIGFIYGWGTDGAGTEIAYNIGRRNRTVLGHGIYLDDGSPGHVVHHNLVEDVWGHGIFIKNPNHVYNNTIVRSGLQMIARAAPLPPYDGPIDLSTAEVFNNVGPERIVDFALSSPDDRAGAAQEVPADWQTLTLPFTALTRPIWMSGSGPLDLSAVDALTLGVVASGEFDLWFDNVALIGNVPGSDLLLDNFDDGNTQNALGDSWWAASGASCPTCDSSSASLAIEPAVGRGHAAHLTVDSSSTGWNSAGVGIPAGLDLTQYRALRLDVRASGSIELRGELGNASYSDNASCPLDANLVVVDACGIDQGRVVPPYTDGFLGAAPDLGAFESGQTRWTAGSPVDDAPIWAACALSLP